jgi:hypothetical protein
MKRSRIVIGLIWLVVLTLALTLVMTRPVEPFTNGIDPKTIELLMRAKDTKLPEGLDPATIIQNLRGLLDKYDNPDLWNHAKRVHGMKPEDLARMNLD